MVPFFWPRIGEQHPDFAKRDVLGQRVEEFARLGVDEMAARETASGGLFATAADALGVDIDAYAGFFGENRRITRQEMPVPGPDFPHH